MPTPDFGKLLARVRGFEVQLICLLLLLVEFNQCPGMMCD